jgi:thiol-disulfide isomerase/thioredoxin
MEFLNDIAPRFAPEKYNLFTNNCNNFSNECATFLTGTGIPNHIVNLPNEVLATPMGRQLLQMMGGAGGNPMDPRTFEGTHNNQQMHLNYGPGNHELPPQGAQGGLNPTTGALTGTSSLNSNTASAGGVKQVTELVSQQDYLREIQANTAVVIDVFTEWCGPCQKIKPFFAGLPSQYPQIRFFKVRFVYRRWT